MSIANNLDSVRQNVRYALANRDANITATGSSVKLVAVTKNHDLEAMRSAIDAGVSAIGENRVQEAKGKHDVLDRTVEWHLIGHLQTNKVRPAVRMFDLIHSVDSERLAAEINAEAGKMNKIQNVLIQVNVADEASKFGVSVHQLDSLIDVIIGLPNLQLCGLMSIAPNFDDREQVRPLFRQLYNMFVRLKAAQLPNTKIEWLSMGMTNDYTVAIEEGANLVRIGTGIFGLRQY